VERRGALRGAASRYAIMLACIARRCDASLRYPSASRYHARAHASARSLAARANPWRAYWRR